MITREILVYICLVFSWMAHIMESYCECPCKKRNIELIKAMSKSEENRNYFAPMTIKRIQKNDTSVINTSSNAKTATKSKTHTLCISEIRKRRRMAKFGF